MKKFLCMPSDFKISTIEAYADLADQFPNLTVHETYGNLNPSPMSSGRNKSSSKLPKVNLSQLEKYVKRSHELGFNMNYTINTACLGGHEFSYKGINELKEFISKIVDIGIYTFTVSIPSLVPILKNMFPKINICSSLICELDTVNGAIQFEKIGYDRLIIDDSITRQFNLIDSISNNTSVPLEILVNNLCLFNCPWKGFHYNLLSHSSLNDNDLELYYHWQCMKVRCSDPAELLKIRWIRPEDINCYDGITFFKIVGRYFATQSDLVKTARIFASGKYDGNLWELFGNFAPQRNHGFYIDNKKLDNFIKPFKNSDKFCQENTCSKCNHCRKFSIDSVDEEKFLRVSKSLEIDKLNSKLQKFHRNGHNFTYNEEHILLNT